MNTLKAMSILVILFMSLLLFAQTNTSSMKLQPTEREKRADRYHVIMDLSTSSNLYKEEAQDREAKTELELIPSVYIGNGFGLMADAVVSKEETGARNTTLSNTKIILSKDGPALAENWGSKFLLGGTAPTDEDARNKDSYQGAASIGAGINGQIKYVALTYTLSGTRNFHGYTFTSEGDANVQYSLTHKATLDYEFIENWTLGLIASYKQGWTYHDFTRQNYTNQISLGHQFAKNWAVSAGIGNEGGAFKANGTDSNIKVYDLNTTVVQASVTFTN